MYSNNVQPYWEGVESSFVDRQSPCERLSSTVSYWSLELMGTFVKIEKIRTSPVEDVVLWGGAEKKFARIDASEKIQYQESNFEKFSSIRKRISFTNFNIKIYQLPSKFEAQIKHCFNIHKFSRKMSRIVFGIKSGSHRDVLYFRCVYLLCIQNGYFYQQNAIICWFPKCESSLRSFSICLTTKRG